jgi:hypothetical protein
MQIGDLATWVSGVATLAAVLSSLFFAFYEKQFAKKDDIVKTRNAVKLLSEQALRALERLQKAEDSLPEEKRRLLPECVTFSIWLLVQGISGKPYLSDILVVGRQIQDMLTGCPTIDDSVEKQYAELIAMLDCPHRS